MGERHFLYFLQANTQMLYRLALIYETPSIDDNDEIGKRLLEGNW